MNLNSPPTHSYYINTCQHPEPHTTVTDVTMAKGGSRPARRRRQKRNTTTSSTTGRIRPDVIRAPLPKFVHMPSQRELDAKVRNTWYYRTPLTINNRFTPIPNRVYEPGRGEGQ